MLLLYGETKLAGSLQAISIYWFRLCGLILCLFEGSGFCGRKLKLNLKVFIPNVPCDKLKRKLNKRIKIKFIKSTSAVNNRRISKFWLFLMASIWNASYS